VNPKPVRRAIPIVLGGNSDAALKRVGAWGDGWYRVGSRLVVRSDGRAGPCEEHTGWKDQSGKMADRSQLLAAATGKRNTVPLGLRWSVNRRPRSSPR
jgi:hypothetical protein